MNDLLDYTSHQDNNYQLTCNGQFDIDSKTKEFYIFGDALATPFYKFGIGLKDGWDLAKTYGNEIAMKQQEMVLRRRQYHLSNSLLCVRESFYQDFEKYKYLIDESNIQNQE